ncbi:MAG: ABC transporter permease, partial [Bosea sp. (in: a-proteobacteria)]|nr:ABC transporter permease [Bosea sp. (in: a-proteobacteria)]
MSFLKLYFRSPPAVIGLLLLIFVLAMAVSADWLYPRDPLA